MFKNKWMSIEKVLLNYYKEIKSFIIYMKLDQSGKESLKHNIYSDIIKHIKKELSSLKQSNQRVSKNQKEFVFRHYINYFEYCYILRMLKNSKHLFDYKKEKLYFENFGIAYRYELSISELYSLLNQYRLKDYYIDYIKLFLSYYDNYCINDNIISMMEEILEKLKGDEYEFNIRVNR